jgi:hypothetical protein
VADRRLSAGPALPTPSAEALARWGHSDTVRWLVASREQEVPLDGPALWAPAEALGTVVHGHTIEDAIAAGRRLGLDLRPVSLLDVLALWPWDDEGRVGQRDALGGLVLLPAEDDGHRRGPAWRPSKPSRARRSRSGPTISHEQRKSPNLGGVTVPEALLKRVKALAGEERGALSAAVREALERWAERQERRR